MLGPSETGLSGGLRKGLKHGGIENPSIKDKTENLWGKQIDKFDNG